MTFVVRPCTSTDDVETVGTADIGDVIIEDGDDKWVVVSVCIVIDPAEEPAGSVPLAGFDIEDEEASRVDVLLPEVVAEITLDDSGNSGEDDDEELVSRLLDEDVVFMGGTKLLNILGEVAPGTPPVVVLVEILLLEDEDDKIEVLLEDVFSELVDDDTVGKTEVASVPVELGIVALDDEDADDATVIDNVAQELEAARLELLELKEVIDGIPALLAPGLCGAEDDGQVNMLELGAEEVPALLVDETGTLKLEALEARVEETMAGADVVDS
ncbi:hypothetical protein SNOG_02655 [Parastagonospora nodorum SN15]|uniref:Uncharacterized protein n=1 Tax=Phaeosphaeria nodorum (strain SN15 / ATCC MYA-4574 / FGSC 10173) TaxID=321614 RepID=Q0V009_PHANO|nr:hypothetical protein SNOG_02655 [Parastagonospora nodorum SN15]KAH3936834.1 hypothetical protein HBH54_020450 [Parastagonospora nodorum]EAT89386.1 hypothetical protein SNOG_02655 [Parastagonospora nodorum SN15]KAH3953492.1 hypothetical protein HBH53_032850 [Parastagonospora nodorum]KAH3969327.1 hypothetical protein HBH51_125010 [Parastagonospora nodorum]KAH4006504.1 hypothetical protein HBI10_020270 [Parastagonospora nodorum]